MAASTWVLKDPTTNKVVWETKNAPTVPETIVDNGDYIPMLKDAAQREGFEILSEPLNGEPRLSVTLVHDGMVRSVGTVGGVRPIAKAAPKKAAKKSPAKKAVKKAAPKKKPVAKKAPAKKTSKKK